VVHPHEPWLAYTVDRLAHRSSLGTSDDLPSSDTGLSGSGVGGRCLGGRRPGLGGVGKPVPSSAGGRPSGGTPSSGIETSIVVRITRPDPQGSVVEGGMPTEATVAAHAALGWGWRFTHGVATHPA
jgi:hypothetical protein